MADKKLDKVTEIIHLLRNGDLEAFRTLVDLYKDKSLSLAISILKNRSLAEDVLQESFIKAYNNIHQFRFKSTFATWLYRIIVNTSYTELKKQKVSLDIDDNNETRELAFEEKHINSLNHVDQQKFIQMAMEQLKADEAVVLRLFYLCEMSLKEIQSITRFGSSKIRQDLHRGRINLKLQLEQLLGEEINDLL